ncbi:MAG TPA: DNA adenine methylase [Terriglobia bacterium]|nr:DNA adenine methylase [Terriglobia bacterium]
MSRHYSQRQLEIFEPTVYDLMERIFQVAKPLRIVNVASVPQRSPFRYPGGKTWLVPYARLWLKSLPSPIEELIEPFAGGGIIGLTAAFEQLAERVTLVELDSDIAAVWQTILNGRGNWLAERIVNFKLTSASARRVIESSSLSLWERAFATIVRNRVQRGGILAPGAGLMKRGENGNGIASRWYPETLGKRIRAIVTVKSRIQFIEGDGINYLEKNASRPTVAYFIDPPYTKAGRRLYKHSEIDDRYLFSLVKRLAGEFLMTYDNTGPILKLANEFGFHSQAITMKNTHHTKMTELLIGRNLDWLSGEIRPRLISP